MTTPVTAPMKSLDLDSARDERAKARAARQEGRGETLPVIIGGKMITVLTAEFALSALEPLTEVDIDIAYVIKAVSQAAQAAEREQQQAALNLLVNVLAANPGMPASLLAAIKEIGRRILGDDGYAALTAWQPTPWDLAALANGLLAWYGLSLGEFSGSPALPSGSTGETSSPTSSGTTAGSTPEGPGVPPGSPVSSAPAVS